MLDNRQTIDKLDFDELQILNAEVLPRAKKWMKNYDIGSPMFDHGKTTVEYWNAQGDEDIRDRYNEFLRDRAERE